jgi:predicted methyltransferase
MSNKQTEIFEENMQELKDEEAYHEKKDLEKSFQAFNEALKNFNEALDRVIDSTMKKREIVSKTSQVIEEFNYKINNYKK